MKSAESKRRRAEEEVQRRADLGRTQLREGERESGMGLLYTMPAPEKQKGEGGREGGCWSKWCDVKARGRARVCGVVVVVRLLL